MLCGLLGSGKPRHVETGSPSEGTGKGVMLVVADRQRPAAIEQLSVLVSRSAFQYTPTDRPRCSRKAGVKKAKKDAILTLSFLIQLAGFLLMKS